MPPTAAILNTVTARPTTRPRTTSTEQRRRHDRRPLPRRRGRQGSRREPDQCRRRRLVHDHRDERRDRHRRGRDPLRSASWQRLERGRHGWRRLLDQRQQPPDLRLRRHPGRSRTFTVSRETTFDDCGALPNLVTVSATNELKDFLDNNTDDATIVVNCPELGIVKTADHEEASSPAKRSGSRSPSRTTARARPSTSTSTTRSRPASAGRSSRRSGIRTPRRSTTSSSGQRVDLRRQPPGRRHRQRARRVRHRRRGLRARPESASLSQTVGEATVRSTTTRPPRPSVARS